MEGLERAQRDPGSVGESGKFLFEPVIAVAAGARPDLGKHPWSKLEFLADSLECRRNERLDFLGKQASEVVPHFVGGPSDDSQREFRILLPYLGSKATAGDLFWGLVGFFPVGWGCFLG
jgi:hypothetical protein